MKVYDFNSGEKATQFADALDDTFPFFRMFLDDAADAVLNMFLGTRKATAQELESVEEAISQGVRRLAVRYPHALPPEVLPQKGYEQELVLVKGAAQILRMLVHLQATAAAFNRVVEFGGNPSTL